MFEDGCRSLAVFTFYKFQAVVADQGQGIFGRQVDTPETDANIRLPVAANRPLRERNAGT
jgi:hypothetical protein